MYSRFSRLEMMDGGVADAGDDGRLCLSTAEL